MGYQNLFLVMMSSILLTLLVIQINSNNVEGSETLQQMELAHTATAIAQQFIDEAKSKKFDSQVGMVDPATMPGTLTPWNSLGAGGWETYPGYNDVDDYHNFSQTLYVTGTNINPDSTNGVPFMVNIQVQYVSAAKPDSTVLTETFLKRMTVTVSSSWLPHSVTVKQIFSYFGVNM
jgi:hypothetical protein